MVPNEAATPHAGLGLKFLNALLHAAHVFVIGFSLIGWMMPATRLANFVLLLTILASWYGLGPLLGKPSAYGYCALTDLQWHVRRRMGIEVPSSGYMKFLIDSMTGRQVDAGAVDKMTALAFFASLAASAGTLLAF